MENIAEGELKDVITYDLILKGGRVIDPANEKDDMLDVAIADGRIADIAEDIDPTMAGECFEVKSIKI